MTKAEQKLVDDLKMRLALHFSDPVEPDVLPPKNFGAVVNGYVFNEHSEEVRKSCSSNILHSAWGWDNPSSRGHIKQYSSKLLALKALRHEMELKFAAKLHKIDQMIEEEAIKK
jgi:hypothetical protein